MSGNWTEKLSQAYKLHLAPDLSEWYDKEMWEKLSKASIERSLIYNVPIKPGDLLDPKSSSIWGGQMLPDSLPVLDNGASDTISMRINPDGTIKEFIQWDHEGATWRPCARSFAEAIILDISKTLEDCVADETGFDLESSLFSWAVACLGLPDDQLSVLKSQFENSESFQISILLEHEIAEIGVRNILTENLLESPLLKYAKQNGGALIAKKLKVPWDVFRLWLYDSSQVPKKYYRKLEKIIGLPINELFAVNWDKAVEHAKAVTRSRKDIAWPYAALGRYSENHERFNEAVEFYLTGLKAMNLTQDFTALWAHKLIGNFFMERLVELAKRVEIPDDEYYSYMVENEKSELTPARNYWKLKAEEAESIGNYDHAYSFWYYAGWDDYVFDDIETVLDGLARNAQSAGFAALYEIAKRHKEAFGLTNIF